eukprot:5891536-Lingulodinium_polyedra.AAC.1
MMRMRAKGPDPRQAQTPLGEEPVLEGGSEDMTAKRLVFLVTFPHPKVEFSQCGVRLAPLA